MSVRYLKPRLSDIPAMQALAADLVEEGIILPRSDDEVATNIRSYTVANVDGRIVGYVALHVHSVRLGEIRSLLVDPAYRGRGIGRALVEHALDEATALGLKEVLALTYEGDFFRSLEFVEIPKETVPEHKIWADCIKCKHFPVCNEISLVKSL
jgi:amino-acid N-acetyltransferase